MRKFFFCWPQVCREKGVNLLRMGAPRGNGRRLRVGLAVLLFAAAGATTWAPELSGFRPFHVRVSFRTGAELHIAAWRPGPVYVPSQIDPATVLGRPTLLFWLRDGQTGAVTTLGRLERPVWPTIVLTFSLALVGLSIGMWPIWKRLGGYGPPLQ